LVDNRYLLVFGAPVRVETVRFTQQLLVTKKNRMMGLSDSERISMMGSAVFTALCTSVQSAVLGLHAVRLSVCLSSNPSVTLLISDHVGWNSSKIISRLISVGFLLSVDPNIMGSALRTEHFQNGTNP